MFNKPVSVRRRGSYSVLAMALPCLAAGAGLIALAGIARKRAADAEVDHPPVGKFVEVDGVALHYVELGSGRPLILLHGNGALIQDFEACGLLGKAAKNYHVIAFDRPGFGHSNRPRSTIWTPSTQADLIQRALQTLGVKQYLLLGHSWGACVAVALALRRPESVKGLILASGYYYPTFRLDALTQFWPAIPISCDLLRYTIAPFLTKTTWPMLMRKLFGPKRNSEAFTRVAKDLAMRPSQIRASAAESGLMIPAALKLENRYSELKMPVAIIVGRQDRLVDADHQSLRLAAEIGHSELHVVEGAGHMVHHASPETVMKAIDEVAEKAEASFVADLPS